MNDTTLLEYLPYFKVRYELSMVILTPKKEKQYNVIFYNLCYKKSTTYTIEREDNLLHIVLLSEPNCGAHFYERWSRYWSYLHLSEQRCNAITLSNSNAEIGPPHYDHSLLNLEHLLTPTMKRYQMWLKAQKHFFFFFNYDGIMEDDTLWTNISNIKIKWYRFWHMQLVGLNNLPYLNWQYMHVMLHLKKNDILLNDVFISLTQMISYLTHTKKQKKNKEVAVVMFW